MPLSALLSAVQAGRTRAFEIAVGRGRAAGIRDQVLLEAALEFDRYAGALERHVIAGYRAAELELSRGGRDERTALLRRLLLGSPTGGVDARELARFRLHPAGRYHCLLTDVSDPARARALEQHWSSCGGLFGVVEGRLAGLTARLPAPAGSLTARPPAPADGHTGLTARLPTPADGRRTGLTARPSTPADGRRTGLTARPSTPADGHTGLTPRPLAPGDGRHAGLSARPSTPADGHTGLAGGEAPVLVVVAPAAPPAEAGTGYALCVPALAAAARFGRTGVHAVADLAGETALTLQPRLAALLGDTLLAALRPADEFHRELASTALAYLDHGQRLDRTAVTLHVHPNTVRYRLRRLQEITGLPPADAEQHLTVLETLRYWWALRTWLDTHPPA
ncbi:helix-turn-helix domain-containing protein [Dactylosporangium aurantiacum]|uniref:Helix-turn-helix domain-containing protein n=1 Tax=Dactylosporangium aurantiacum TaxID=35754 RepID=A0A9Q9MHZ4_9ACTN|nr:helix-turn-helix domain-containing protein [Dactylosporangium aurantiacum]